MRSLWGRAAPAMPWGAWGAWGAVAVLAGCQVFLPSAITVDGTGDPARDVAAVQSAADAGGRVVLRGSFDFGERGRVTLARDVEIAGAPGASIRGGFFTFYSPVPASLPAPAPGPRIVIRDLAFTGALWAPINIGHASGLVVSGNRISGLRAHPLPMPGIADGRTQAGVLFGNGWAYESLGSRRHAPGVFTGTVRIEGNTIDVAADLPTSTLGYGIFGQWTDGVEATVSGNTVTGASRNAFEMIDHYRSADGRGRIVVKGNRLGTAQSGIPFPGRQTPNGVLVGYFSDRKAGTDPSRRVPVEIEDNVVEVRGAMSMGIAVTSDGARVRGNTVSIDGDASVGVMVFGSDHEIGANVLRGRGAAGISVVPFDVFAASRNRLSGNDLGALRAARAGLVLHKGSADNVCDGAPRPARVIDEGERNRCP